MYLKGTLLVKQSHKVTVFSCPQQGYTGRLGPNFCGARKGAGPDCVTVAGTGGHRLGGMQCSPKDSLVAFGLAPCLGLVLWHLCPQEALEPLLAVIPGRLVSLTRTRAGGPGENRFFFKLEHNLAMVTSAIALHSLQRDRGLCYILLIIFWRSQMYGKVHDFVVA